MGCVKKHSTLFTPEQRRDVRMNIGRRIRELRLARGYTQRELAEEWGAGESYFRGVESGSKDCSLWRYMGIADLFGVSLADLFVYVK